MCKGTKAQNIIAVLTKIPCKRREIVKEVTLDMSSSMNMIVRDSFPNAILVTDRFHVQKIVTEAVQEIRIDIRKQVIKSENEAHKRFKKKIKNIHRQSIKMVIQKNNCWQEAVIYYLKQKVNGQRLRKKEQIFFLVNILRLKMLITFQ